VGHVDNEHMKKATLADDQQAIQTFAACAADEAFHDGVRRRCLVRGMHHPDTRACQELIEGVGELGTAIVDEEAHALMPIVGIRQQVSRLLADPGAGRVGRNRDVLNAARGKREKHQLVVAPKPHGICSEEVGRQDTLRPGSQKGSQFVSVRRGADGRPALISSLRTALAETTMPRL